MSNKLYNVGAYVRLSVEKDESQSIENQQEMLSRFISMMPGWVEKKFYIDNGFSGGNYNRPAFQEMMTDVRSGNVNLILVKDLSRFGRNYLETGRYLEEELPKLDCRFVALLDNVDTADGENDIIPFINGLNDYYLKNLSDRIKSVLTAKAKDGQYITGKAPYGYKRDPDNHMRLQIDKNAADVVRMIFAMRADGKGVHKITAELNRQKITPSRLYYYNLKNPNQLPPDSIPQTWEKTAVTRILENEIYIGNTVQLKHKSLSCRTKKQGKRDKDEWARVENTHTPIIDKALWEAVQAVNARGKSKYTNRREPQQHLFSKLLRCPDCGRSFQCNEVNYTRKDGSVTQSKTYICKAHATTGGTKCTRHAISEKSLKQIVLAEIQEHSRQVKLDENRVLELLKEKLIGNSKKKNIAKSKREFEHKLYTFEVQTTKLYEDRCEGIISDTRFTEMIAGLEKKRCQVESELAALNQSESDKQERLSDIQNWIARVRENSDVTELDRATLEALIDKIEVGEREVVDGVKRQDVRVYYKFVGLV